MFNLSHIAFYGHSIFMLLLVALIILFAEQMGERSGSKVPRRIIRIAAFALASLVILVNGVLFFNLGWALFALRFDILFFVLVPPFCFGLWEKSKR